ncbi:MHYT domain-containing protein [Colwellia sp. RE-S-Sl-9]
MFDTILALFQYPSDNLLIVGSFKPWLVVLSVAIAIFSSFMGMHVASHATNNRSDFWRQFMLLIGSIALGGGVWSMHFIGMIAFQLCTPVNYQFQLTLISMLPSVFASWVTLNMITRSKITWSQLAVSGTLVGLGIGTMHYVGMAAMEMSLLLRYDLPMFALSIVVAAALAMLSLWVYTRLRDSRYSYLGDTKISLLASIVMGSAIAGMHYTGMAAARFVRPEGFELSSQSSSISMYLAILVTVATLVITALVLGANILLKYKDISAAIKDREVRLTAMMDTAADGILTIDSQGRVISSNKAIERLLGWSSEALIGKHVYVIAPEIFKAEHENYFERFIETKQVTTVAVERDIEALHKDGSTIAVRLSIGHVKIDNDDFFIAFVTDIRQRLSLERQRQENEEKYRSLITNIPGIAYRCVVTEKRPMIFISDAVERITGYPAKDFTLPNPVRYFSDLVYPEDIPEIEKKMALKKNNFDLEFRITDRFGSIKWLIGQGSHIQSPSKEEHWLDGFIMDITDRKKMEEELVNQKNRAEEAVAARTSFLANMSHEIRTPMNAIIGFSDIMLDEAKDTSDTKHLKSINQSAKSLLHLLNDILDSAKMDKGKFELEFRDFSLIEEIDTVVSTLWLEARHKGLALSLDISPQLVPIYHGASDRIRQVLTNLIGNAVKFTAKGQVTLCVKPREDNTVEFSITDTGIGMSPEQLNKVFDAFSQADASMSRIYGGTGLGTTISKQLVELMGGTLSATSEKNKGSTFTFVIPLKASANKVLIKPSTKIQLPPLNILVVDDIVQNIELLTRLLQRDGHSVNSALDGKQALQMMEAEEFDAVLMDIQMPVMDGLATARARRIYETSNNIPNIPIIALTASVLEDDRRAAKNAGMNGFASKPVDIDIVYIELAHSLGIKLEQPEINNVNEVSPSALIDYEKGKVLWGTQQRLIQELSLFVKNYGDITQQLINLCKNKQWKKLAEEGHKLKGLSGNLALTKLHRLFSGIEQSANNKDEKSCIVCIDDIDATLISLKEFITNKPNDENITLVQNKLVKLTEQEWQNLLYELEKMIERQGFDEALLNTLNDVAYSSIQELSQKLILAVNDFEYESAKSLIQELITLVKKDGAVNEK